MSSHTPDIIYIHPAKQQVGFPFTDPRFSYLTPFTLFPMGVIGLMNLLRGDGLMVQGLNYPAESFIRPGFDLYTWLQDIGQPRLILIDLHWYEHSFGALDVARVCKRVYPYTHVAIGGLTASQYSREILESFDCIDYVIRGDAEEPLRQLAGVLCSDKVDLSDLQGIPNLSYQSGLDVIENPLSYQHTSDEFDNLNLVDLDWLSHADRYLGFEYVGRRGLFYPDEAPRERAHWLSIGRGCLYNCSFCGGGGNSHLLVSGRQQVLLRSVNRIVDDLELLRDQGVDQVALSLDPSIMGETYWKTLFQEISDRHLRVGLYIEAFQLPSHDFIEAYVECADLRHSQIALSLLSGDEQVRRLNGKHYSNHALFEALNVLKRRRVPLAIYYSFNLPGQDDSAMRKTLFLTQRLGRLYPEQLLMVYNQPHTVDPCSPMSLQPEEHGVDVDLRAFQDYFDYCRKTAVERPGVFGYKHRGFSWRGRSASDEAKMQAMWLAFARQQRFTCF